MFFMAGWVCSEALMWDLTRWFVWEVDEEVVEEVGCDYRKHGEGMGSAGRERESETPADMGILLSRGGSLQRPASII